MSKHKRGRSERELERMFTLATPVRKATGKTMCPTCGKVEVKHWSHNCVDCIERLNSETEN